MSAATLIYFVTVLFLGFSFLHDFPLHASNSDVGFYCKLFHRDSPKSPFRNPNSTIFSHNRAAIHRSAAHKNRHTNSRIPNSNFKTNISTILTAAGDMFEYIMLIKIGTPSKRFYGLMDSGSDLMWMLCSPCKNCFKHEGQLFRPKASSTYAINPCHSDECSILTHAPCHGHHPPCIYSYGYADMSNVSGILSTETLTFNTPPGTRRGKFSVPGIIFGCTHKTEGYFNNLTTGIVGLGPTGHSLVRQLGSHGGNKFSYCLPFSTADKATQIYFGSAAVVSHPNAVSTPLYITDPPHSFYNIALDKIHVTNGARTIIILPRRSGMPHDDRIMVDSGVALTFIRPEMMLNLSNTLETFIPNRRVDVPEEEAPWVDICFDSRPTQEMPLIKFEFMGGAIVTLKMLNAFMLVNPETICLAISSNAKNNGQSVIGSQAQSTTRMVYDLDALKLTFLSDDC